MLPVVVHACARVVGIYQWLKFAAPLKVPFTPLCHLGPSVKALLAPRARIATPLGILLTAEDPRGHAGRARWAG
jgi:hypothetical protein